jgi:hypothetical protein
MDSSTNRPAYDARGDGTQNDLSYSSPPPWMDGIPQYCSVCSSAAANSATSNLSRYANAAVCWWSVSRECLKDCITSARAPHSWACGSQGRGLAPQNLAAALPPMWIRPDGLACALLADGRRLPEFWYRRLGREARSRSKPAARSHGSEADRLSRPLLP